MSDEILSTIRRLAERDKIAIKKHSALRMHQRGITIGEVRDALTSAEIVEEYREDYPYPSFLILGYTRTKRPIHAVVVIEPFGEVIWVITAYEPDTKEWESNFRRRKR